MESQAWEGVLKHGLIFYLGHYGPYHKDISLVLWLARNSDNLQEGWDFFFAVQVSWDIAKEL